MVGPANDPEEERQRRLDALRRITEQSVESAREPERKPLAEALATTQPSREPRTRPRWLIPVVAGVVVVAVVVAVVAGVARGFSHGKQNAKTATGAATMTDHIFTLPASAQVYCPSAPVWSPDGQEIAVMAQTVAPQDLSNCWPYADGVSGGLLVNSSTSYNSSGSLWNTVILVINARTGVVMHMFNAPDPADTLCADLASCKVGYLTPNSLAWTPDGTSLAVLTDQMMGYITPSGQQMAQERAVLDVMRADGTGTPRALLALGRSSVITGDIEAANLYSSPQFSFNLTSGATNFTDIHEEGGPYNILYAPAFQMDSAGHITALQALTPGASTIWSYATLQVYGPSDSLPYANLTGSVWMWSADGNEVVPSLMTGAHLDIPNATVNMPNNMTGLYQPPFIFPPDSAVTAAAREAAKLNTSAYLALAPNGRMLASFLCEKDATTGKLTIRAAASGKTLVSAPYEFPQIGQSLGCAADAEAITWSPDGTRVALTDPQDNQIVIWNVPATA